MPTVSVETARSKIIQSWRSSLMLASEGRFRNHERRVREETERRKHDASMSKPGRIGFYPREGRYRVGVRDGPRGPREAAKTLSPPVQIRQVPLADRLRMCPTGTHESSILQYLVTPLTGVETNLTRLTHGRVVLSPLSPLVPFARGLENDPRKLT